MSRKRKRNPQGKMQKSQRMSLIKGLGSKSTSGNDPQGTPESYNSVGSPYVPTEQNTFQKFAALCSQFGTAIGFVLILASTISAYFIFKEDLSRAKEDISTSKTNIQNNTISINKIDKSNSLILQELVYLKNGINKIESNVESIVHNTKNLEIQQALLQAESQRNES